MKVSEIGTQAQAPLMVQRLFEKHPDEIFTTSEMADRIKKEFGVIIAPCGANAAVKKMGYERIDMGAHKSLYGSKKAVIAAKKRLVLLFGKG